jgi:hypothetical protein
MNDTDKPDQPGVDNSSEVPQDALRDNSANEHKPQVAVDKSEATNEANDTYPQQKGPVTLPFAQQAEPQSVAMPNTPILIVLQWLAYAFWGWTILAVIWLGYIVLANMLTNTDLTSAIPYAIASTLVLLPLSFVVDAFYGRKETTKKTGPAIIVMVIHAVLFALFGIGTLISAVFVVIQLAINSSGDNGIQLSILLTLFLSTVLYPLPKVPIARIYKYVMAAIIGVLVVLAFVGPVAKSVQTKDDRDIANGISYVATGVNDYVEQHSELPKSLSDLRLNDDAKLIVDKGFVTYKPEGVVEKVNESGRADDSLAAVGVDKIHRYQLCVTYKEENKGNGSYGYSRSQDGYEEYLSVYDHPAGEVCYKLQSTVYAEYIN